MNYSHLINDLEELTRQFSITVRYEKGDFEGGYCILKDQKILVINKRLSDARKASALAVGLAEYGIETAFIKPNLRSFIEDEVAKASKTASGK